MNIPLTDTVSDILLLSEIQKLDPQILVLLSIENPFINNKIIDDAINSMLIFKTDSLISVREETNMFFRHDGGGMKPILNHEKFTKLEREALYKYTGGIIAVRTNHFKEFNKLISGVVGHIVIDQRSAHTIRTKFDMEIAQLLAEKALE
ncbi:MAG: hypothetical protein HY738_13520 [Bacteroidia bacterium]|nr:hypothetical protein [Bacteroidia bacterium]